MRRLGWHRISFYLLALTLGALVVYSAVISQ